MLRIEKKIHYEKKISEEHFTYGNMQMVSKHEKKNVSNKQRNKNRNNIDVIICLLN